MSYYEYAHDAGKDGYDDDDDDDDIDWSPSQQQSTSSDDDDDSSETIEGSERDADDAVILFLGNEIDKKLQCEHCFAYLDFSSRLDDVIDEVCAYVTNKYNAAIADGLTDEMTESEYYVYKDIMRAELGEKQPCRHCEL